MSKAALPPWEVSRQLPRPLLHLSRFCQRRRLLQAKRLKDKSYKDLEAALRQEVIGWRQERGKRSAPRAWAAWWGAKVLHLKIYFFAKLFPPCKGFVWVATSNFFAGALQQVGTVKLSKLLYFLNYWSKESNYSRCSTGRKYHEDQTVQTMALWVEVRTFFTLSTIFNPFCTDTFGKGRQVSQRFWRLCPRKMGR